MACPSWLSLAKLHGITPLMPSVLVQLGFQPVTSCFTQFNTLLTDWMTWCAVILLPLRPASLIHKNPQRCKIIHGMHPIGCKDRSIWICVFVEVSCSCKFCCCYYGCGLTMHISFSLCCAWKQKDYNLISVFNNYCSSPNVLWVNGPWGRRPNGLLTQRPWGREE